MSMSTAFSLSKLWNIPWLKHHRKHPDWNGDRDWIPSGIKHGDGEIPHFLEGWILDAPIESSIYGGFPIAMFDRRVNLDLGQQSNSIVSISMASPSLHGTCSIPRCSLFRCEIMYSHWESTCGYGSRKVSPKHAPFISWLPISIHQQSKWPVLHSFGGCIFRNHHHVMHQTP